MLFKIVLLIFSFASILNNNFFLVKAQSKNDINLEIKNDLPKYLLGPGDTLSIKIYKFDNFKSTVTILPDGTINLPRINSLYVNNLTLDEANFLITKSYKQIIRNPIVYIDLLKSRAIRINISGEVQRPGIYTMNNRQQNQISNSDGGESLNIKSKGWPSVIEAIQIAGGLTVDADFRSIKLQRLNKINGEIEEVNIDFWNAFSNGTLSKNYPIFDGDKIHVLKALDSTQYEKNIISKTNLAPLTITVTVIGEITNPGKTNVRSNSPIKQAILNAGGYTSRANRSKLTLLRLNNNGRIENNTLKTKDLESINNLYLKDRDVVVVAENNLSKTSKNLRAVVEPFTPIISASTMYKLLFRD